MRTWLFMVLAWPSICALMFLTWWLMLCFCLIAQHKCMAAAWQWHFFAMTTRMTYCRQLCSFCLRVNAFCFKRGFLRITRHLATSLRCSRSRHLDHRASSEAHRNSNLESRTRVHRVTCGAFLWHLPWLTRWASVIAMLLVSMPPAACKGIVCDSCLLQPWLSVCRSHPLVDHNPVRLVPEVHVLLGTVSGVPLRSLSGNWRCSIEWGDLRDVRSAAVLPVLSIWADTLVHLLSTRLLLQPFNATCRDTFCDSCCLQHRLSGCHRHLLIEYRTQRPNPQDTDLLGLESGVPPCPLPGNQDFNAVYGSIHPVPEVPILLGPVSGAPPRPLLGNRSCSTALPNSSDARSVAALPAQQYWAVPSVRFIPAGFDLQSINAAYRGPICAINSTQPWLSVCRSHLLVDSDLKRPVTEVEALLETASGVQLCFLTGGWICRLRMEWRDLWDVRPVAVLPVLWTRVTTPVHLPSTRLHLQSPGTVCKAALLGTESGAPPCPMLGILCFRTVWQDSCNFRSVLAFPGLPLWRGFYISGYLWPWPSAYRYHLFVVFASMRPISQVPTLLRLVSGVPPRPCWVATLVRFSSIGFGVTPTGNPGGEPQWLRFAIRLQCRLHEREREGRSLLQQDAGRSMRRKARMAEPLLKWHRKRKPVRSRGRPS